MFAANGSVLSAGSGLPLIGIARYTLRGTFERVAQQLYLHICDKMPFLSLSLRCKNVIRARRMIDKKVREYVSILFA